MVEGFSVGFPRKNDAYRTDWIAVQPSTPLLTVLRQMAEARAICAVVQEQGQFLGLVTEQDALRAMAQSATALESAIATLMTASVPTLKHSEIHPPDLLQTDVLQQFRQGTLVCLPVLDEAGHVVHVLTPRTLLSAMSTTEIQQVASRWQQAIAPIAPNVRSSFHQSSDRASGEWPFVYAINQRSAPQQPSIDGQHLQELVSPIDPQFQYSQLLYQTQIQAQRQQALNQVIKAIRNSLDLDQIFSTTVFEVGQLLHLDWVEIVRYHPTERLWQNVAEYRRDETLNSALGVTIPDDNNVLAAELRQQRLVRIDDVSICHDPVNQRFAQDFPGGWLLVPVVVEQVISEQQGHPVWGSLSLMRCSLAQPWQDWEVELAMQIADQLAIAIQQSQLYEQIQQLNIHLESQVAERTLQLQTSLLFEDLLRRITERVRDSLDENQILETAVRELAAGLQTHSCNTGLYDLEKQTSTIWCEQAATGDSPKPVFNMTDYPGIYSQLLQGVCFQFCWIHPVALDRPTCDPRSIVLVCPLIDDQGVIGDLWLTRQNDMSFTEREVRLVQQVATQCAIAIRQSRLFQASQAQVRELERLNLLKDNFLCSVSHELRTPMASIKMASQMLEICLQEANLLAVDGAIARYFQILKDECQRELMLINDLLDLSRLEAETEPLLLSTLDLKDWLLHLAEPFLARMHQQQQQPIVAVPSDLPPLTTDFSYLGRIVSELLNNACKYTPAHEAIMIAVEVCTMNHLPQEMADREGNYTVHAIASGEIPTAHLLPSFTQANGLTSERSPQLSDILGIGSTDERESGLTSGRSPQFSDPASDLCFCIHIRNSGVEIPPEEQKRIFERFYRIPNNDPWKHNGTGLGLALVEKLVEQIHGKISLISGQGWTTFTVQLPQTIHPIIHPTIHNQTP